MGQAPSVRLTRSIQVSAEHSLPWYNVSDEAASEIAGSMDKQHLVCQHRYAI